MFHHPAERPQPALHHPMPSFIGGAERKLEKAWAGTGPRIVTLGWISCERNAWPSVVSAGGGQCQERFRRQWVGPFAGSQGLTLILPSQMAEACPLPSGQAHPRTGRWSEHSGLSIRFKVYSANCIVQGLAQRKCLIYVCRLTID